jgi:RNA polymerase sigma factor (sigma-70 family)
MADFPETRWSQLLELRDPAHPRYAEHLEELARQYWKPMYHYVRALRRVSAGDAEDHTQQFFAMLLGRGDLEKLSPDRGSFRGFLKTALRNFLASADRASAARPMLFPFAEAEADWQRSADLGPEDAFDREWGRGILLEAAARLRREAPAAAYEMFREYCLGEAEMSYEELARKHGVTADDVRNRLREMRQRLREILKHLLRDTLAPGRNAEDELAFLLSR